MIELKYFEDIPTKQDIEKTAQSSQDIIAEIERLKKEKNALILAHNYQKPEIPNVAPSIGLYAWLNRPAPKDKVVMPCLNN